MKRFILLTDANTFPNLGAGATLAGCVNDSKNHIRKLLLGPWQRSGYDKAYLLSEQLNDAENVRERLKEMLMELTGEGDVLVGPGNSSHGTHGIDHITGQKMSCTVCHNSDWSRLRSFMSKLDYKRAFDQYLKPGVKVFSWFDSCESGNMGEAFRFAAQIKNDDRVNRWLEPPIYFQKDLAKLKALPPGGLRLPQQVCTMAFCSETGTCADIQGPAPHGLGSAYFDGYLLGHPSAKWVSELAPGVNAQLAAQGEEQRFFANGPDIPFDEEKAA